VYVIKQFLTKIRIMKRWYIRVKKLLLSVISSYKAVYFSDVDLAGV